VKEKESAFAYLLVHASLITTFKLSRDTFVASSSLLTTTTSLFKCASSQSRSITQLPPPRYTTTVRYHVSKRIHERYAHHQHWRAHHRDNHVRLAKPGRHYLHPSRIPAAPPIIPFSSLSSYDQTIIHRHTATIAAAWSLVSPASVFPGQYLPDPDSNSWGISLLDSIQRLARLACTAALMTEAVGCVVQSVEQENTGMYSRI
jgi:hypothetical protein